MSREDTKDLLVADSFGTGRANMCKQARVALQQAIIAIDNYSDYTNDSPIELLDQSIALALIKFEQFAIYFNRVNEINEAREQLLEQIKENLRYGG